MKLLRVLLALVLILSFSVPVFATPISGSDTDVSSFYHEDYTFHDETADAQSTTDGDVEWTYSGGDSFYVGSSGKFSAVYFDISGTSYSSTPPSMSYYDGSTWTSLSGTFSHSPFMGSTGIKTFTFTPPSDWAVMAPYGGTSYYYVKMAADGVQGAQVDQVSVIAYSATTPEFGTVALLMTLVVGGLFIVGKTQQLGTPRMAA